LHYYTILRPIKSAVSSSTHVQVIIAKATNW